MSTLAAVGRFWVEQAWPLSVQVALLVAVVAAITLLLPRLSPRLRYVLWLVVLLRLCVPAPIHSPVGLASMSLAGTRAPYIVRQSPGQDAGPAPSIGSRVEVPAPKAALGSRPASDRSGPSQPAGLVLPAVIAVLWLSLAAALGTAVLGATVRARRLMRSARPVEREAVSELFARLRAHTAPRSPVELRVAPPACPMPLPAVIGLRRPVILISHEMAFQWDVERLAPVLMHELVHIKRGDPWVNLVQVVVQVAYSFHPLVWYANRQIRRERELICDDEVLRHFGTQAEPYIDAMLRAAEASPTRRWATDGALAMAEEGSALARRIKRVLAPGYVVPRPPRALHLAAVMLLGLVTVALASGRAVSTVVRHGQATLTVVYLKAAAAPTLPTEPVTAAYRTGALVLRTEPDFLGMALALGIPSRVKVGALVERTGRVMRASVEEGWDPALDELCLEAVRESRFEPTLDGQGRPVRVLVTVAIELRPNEISKPLVPLEDPDWMRTVLRTYTLRDDQALRIIRPLVLGVRVPWFRSVNPEQAARTREAPTVLLVRWDPATRAVSSRGSGVGFGGSSLADYLGLLGIRTLLVEDHGRLLAEPIWGDLLVRQGASQEDLTAALERELREQFELPVTMRWQEEMRDVIVARGRYAFTPPSASDRDRIVRLFPPPERASRFASRGSGTLRGFLEYPLADATHTPFVCEVPGADEIFVQFELNYDAASPPRLQTLLDELSKQTGLTFASEKRSIRVLRLTRDS